MALVMQGRAFIMGVVVAVSGGGRRPGEAVVARDQLHEAPPLVATWVSTTVRLYLSSLPVTLGSLLRLEVDRARCGLVLACPGGSETCVRMW